MEFWRELRRWTATSGRRRLQRGHRTRPEVAFHLAIVLLGLGLTARAAEPTFYDARVAPILEHHCVTCHGDKKQKAELRLDSFEHAMKGAGSGDVIKPGDVKGSELFRRITLPRDDEEAMPGDGKPPLSAAEIKIIELWIAGGASREKTLADFPGAPALPSARPAASPLAPDWRPRAKEIAALEQELGVRLAPRSQVPTDGLILRTASAPARCDDATLARLESVAELIVDAELARTKVTDAGLKSLATCANLRAIDLTRTAITSAGLKALAALGKLETINLTATAVDDAGVATLKTIPSLKRVWLFGTKATVDELPAKVATN